MSARNHDGAHSAAHGPDPFGAAMDILDLWWDPDARLVLLPNYGHHDTRATLYYALGLLERPQTEHRQRALQGLCRVLELQWDTPNTPWHGTFARFPGEFPGGPDKEVWRDFDPNWREFIGTGLLAILDLHARRLPPNLVTVVHRALALAAEGAAARRVSPSYTNAALMSAFLLDRAGALHGRPVWADQGAALAAEIADQRHAAGAFAEFNSPTYYGVDLCALAQWRRFAASDTLRRLGAEIEAALWDDIAQFYHPHLRNLCGPFVRSYGMDMTRYCAITGLWIAAAVPESSPPLPGMDSAFDHAHDIAFAPLVRALGVQPPDAVRQMLRAPDTRRYVRRELPGPVRRTATALLGRSWMAGGLDSGRLFDPARFPQAVPFTMHWHCPDGSVGWVRNAPGTALDAVVREDGSVTLAWQPSRSTGDVRVGVVVHAAGVAEGMTGRERWDLPGCAVRVTGSPEIASLRRKGDELAVAYRVGAGAEVTMTLASQGDG